LWKQRETGEMSFQAKGFLFLLDLCQKKKHHFGISQTKLFE
jgi:hypothetical protein